MWLLAAAAVALCVVAQTLPAAVGFGFPDGTLEFGVDATRRAALHYAGRDVTVGDHLIVTGWLSAANWITEELTLHVGPDGQFQTLPSALTWLQPRKLLALVTVRVSAGEHALPSNLVIQGMTSPGMIAIVGDLLDPSRVVLRQLDTAGDLLTFKGVGAAGMRFGGFTLKGRGKALGQSIFAGLRVTHNAQLQVMVNPINATAVTLRIDDFRTGIEVFTSQLTANQNVEVRNCQYGAVVTFRANAALTGIIVSGGAATLGGDAIVSRYGSTVFAGLAVITNFTRAGDCNGRSYLDLTGATLNNTGLDRPCIS